MHFSWNAMITAWGNVYSACSLCTLHFSTKSGTDLHAVTVFVWLWYELIRDFFYRFVFPFYLLRLCFMSLLVSSNMLCWLAKSLNINFNLYQGRPIYILSYCRTLVAWMIELSGGYTYWVAIIQRNAPEDNVLIIKIRHERCLMLALILNWEYSMPKEECEINNQGTINKLNYENESFWMLWIKL